MEASSIGRGRGWKPRMREESTKPAAERPYPGRRPQGLVRSGLVDAGIELARAGGPDAVALREATRRVGVSPNAAYRHFADRDALLGAVCVESMRLMAERMEAEVARVAEPADTASGATECLSAIGRAYLDFARAEPGLFATAFAVPRHLEYASAEAAAGSGGRTPFQMLSGALDLLVAAKVLPSERRPGAEYPVWASVHGMAVLATQGPLRQLPPHRTDEIAELLLAFIVRGL